MARSSFFRRSKTQTNPDENFSIELGMNLEENLQNLKKMLDEPEDLVIREFTIGKANHKCAIVYIDGIIDKDIVQTSILENFQRISEIQQLPERLPALFDEIHREFITVTKIEKGNTLDDVSNAILSGQTIFYLDGIDTVLLMNTIGGETRQIMEPITETLVRGPRTGFVESLGTNLSLIRRYIQDPNLRFKSHQIGRRTKQTLIIAYIDGIINPDILKEVNRRLQMIDIDDAIESGFVEQWIEDSFLSPFPQMLNTERPDRAVSEILQGKVAILLNGTPFVLIAPITIGDVLKSSEDYYERWIIGSLLRLLRYFGAFIGIFLPAIYIALVSFHEDLLPSKLAFSIAASREGVPFPAFVEALLMVVTMELLQEAGARLPKTIGQTIGIVGGLVIGEAAVQAGIVSPIMVIVIALTAIAIFTNPMYSLGISFRIIRIGFMFAAAIFGLYGIVLVYIMVNIHLVNLVSFGVPYSTPFAPTIFKDWKDLFIRAPLTMLTRRPKYLLPKDKKSVDKGVHKS